MLRSFGRLFLVLLPSTAMSFPVSLDIGTFAIDNYSANGGGMSNLQYQIASGQNFFAGANANVPGYTASLSGGTSGPNLVMDRRDTQVSKAAVTSTSIAVGNREFNDFIFYGGHGLGGGLYLGSGADYGGVGPADMTLGMGYNRWFIANSCITFRSASPAATWSPGFMGLKAMLGFASVVFDNNQSWELYDDFWKNWTWREKSLMNSFFDSHTNYGYKHLYPSLGLEPGCLSAPTPPGQGDHCWQTFRSTEKNYSPGAQTGGFYYNRIIGSPVY